MKKFSSFLVMACLASLCMVFTACDKDKDKDKDGDGSGTTVNSSVIEAKNVIGGNSYTTRVDAEVYDYDADTYVSIATSPYQNKGFKLTLPGNLNVKYLESIGDLFDADNTDEIKISDKNAKGCLLEDFCAYDKNDNYGGYFYFGDTYEGMTEMSVHYVVWIYVDRDVTVKGTQSEYDGDEDIIITINATANLNLKKGWNVVYNSVIAKYNFSSSPVTVTMEVTMTNKKPSSANLKWYFGNDRKKSTKGEDNLKFGKLLQRNVSKILTQN